MQQPKINIINPTTNKPFSASAFAGAGAGFGGQLRGWSTSARTVDSALLPTLKTGNARADDLVRNHGIAQGGVQLHIDNIVGHLFRLSSKPRWRSLGISESDGRMLADDIEAVWMEIAEDPVGCWLDAERKRTFTMLVREGIGTHTTHGEITSAAEWIVDRPLSVPRTAIKVVSAHRISNPNNLPDSASVRGGVRHDSNGAAVSYFIQSMAENALGFGDGLGYNWNEVSRETSWGRQQFLHVFEPTDDGQSRGANKFLSIMEQLHMLSKLQNTKLQNAIVNAMYAATIETELGGDAAMEMIGGENGLDEGKLTNYLTQINAYHEGANIRMNGVKVPHLLPGEHLDLKTSQQADNGYSDFEASLLRYVAAGLGVSYEQLARDYSKTNYSSARASIMESWRYFTGKRKVIASRYASMIYTLVLEEMIQRKWITLPRKATRNFYEAKSAWSNAEWIGSGRIAIDGLKEVKEAVLKIESGLSTYEKEIALLGDDYQEIFAQQVREVAERRTAGLPPPSWMNVMALDPDQNESAEAGNQR